MKVGMNVDNVDVDNVVVGIFCLYIYADDVMV